MLLQTFVQLNILLLAAPAFAGWTAMPLGQPLLAQAARVALMPRAEIVEASRAASASPRRAAARLCTPTERPADARLLTVAATPVEPALCPFHPFPRAARAP